MARSKNRWLIVVAVVVAVILLLAAAVVIAYRPTVVPDVTLKTVAEATSILEQSGLALGETSQVATSAIGVGLIAEQQPRGSASAAMRSAVDVRVAVQPTESTVPNVTGNDAASAEAALIKSLYQPVSIDVFGVDEQEGTVVGQAPAANARWMTGRPVAIAVAAGPDDGTGVKVPDLTGKSLESALAALDEAGLGGNGLVRDVAAPEANVVVDQLPKGGVIVRSGTTVLIYLEMP